MAECPKIGRMPAMRSVQAKAGIRNARCRKANHDVALTVVYSRVRITNSLRRNPCLSKKRRGIEALKFDQAPCDLSDGCKA